MGVDTSKKVINHPRELAIVCVNEVQNKHLLVPEVLDRLSYRLKDPDLRLALELIYGTFRYRFGIRRMLDKLLTRPESLPDLCHALLEVSVYQMRFTRIPHHAVLNEANDLARRLGLAGFRKLVNGVLRNVQRRGESLWDEYGKESQLLPEWLISLIKEQYGPSCLENWVAAWMERPVQSGWMASPCECPEGRESEWLPHAWLLEGTMGGLEHQPFYVQNESAQWVAELVLRLGPRKILDFCAAPGGKSLYMNRFGEGVDVWALDRSQERLSRLRENMERLNLELKVIQGDALDFDGADGPWDVVLVDAPCSGLGIIGRHPEIKSLRDGVLPDKLKRLQIDLMEAGWKHVAPGGYLVYSVCSFDRREVPAAPEGAVDCSGRAQSWAPEGFPLSCDDDGLWITPGPRLDGFRIRVCQRQP